MRNRTFPWSRRFRNSDPDLKWNIWNCQWGVAKGFHGVISSINFQACLSRGGHYSVRKYLFLSHVKSSNVFVRPRVPSGKNWDHFRVCFWCRPRVGVPSNPRWVGNRPRGRWREVIRHRFGISPNNASWQWGFQKQRRWSGGSTAFVFRPLLWIMQPSVRSAHCPPLDSLISSVTITHLPFTLALTPETSPVPTSLHPPPPLILHFSEKHRRGRRRKKETAPGRIVFCKMKAGG